LTSHSLKNVPESIRYAMVVDLRKCTGCESCSIACKMENSVPLGVWRTWVNNMEKGEFPYVRRFFLPLLCNNCESPHCVEVCPVKATYKRSDGIVEINPHLCIGCKICILACPYQMRYLHPYKKMAEKCNWCFHRIKAGMEPACVAVCPTGALTFGNLKDRESRVARLVSTNPIQVLKPGMGTNPHVFYIGSDTNLSEIGGSPYR